LQISLQRRDSSLFEQTGQNSDASSLTKFPGNGLVIPAETAAGLEEPLLRSSATEDPIMGFTPCSTAAPL
jgi:hypothetical protein